MKKIAIIGTAGTPAKYGGFETLVHHLITQWNGKYDLTVYCSTKFYKPEERVKTWKGAKLVYLPFNANGFQSIIYDIVSIFHALFVADTLLVLGVSGGIILPFVKLFTNKKIIVNIDGLEWRRPKWNTYVQTYLKISELLAVKYSDIDITDNAALKRYTALKYKTLSYLVAYGADHVSAVTPTQQDINRYPVLSKDYSFKVCRIEPENNIKLILKAYAQMPDKNLVFVGNWDKSEYGQKLKEKYCKLDNIYIYDPIYDQHELDLLRSNCSLYVHGHSAGGTNPSLVEAMYLKLPIIAFDVGYNKATMTDKGEYFKNTEDLIKKVNSFTPAHLANMAEEMSLIAKKLYSWKVIASKYNMLIMSLEHKYSKTNVESNLSRLPISTLREMNLSHLKETKKFYNA